MSEGKGFFIRKLGLSWYIVSRFISSESESLYRLLVGVPWLSSINNDLLSALCHPDHRVASSYDPIRLPASVLSSSKPWRARFFFTSLLSSDPTYHGITIELSPHQRLSTHLPSFQCPPFPPIPTTADPTFTLFIPSRQNTNASPRPSGHPRLVGSASGHHPCLSQHSHNNRRSVIGHIVCVYRTAPAPDEWTHEQQSASRKRVVTEAPFLRPSCLPLSSALSLMSTLRLHMQILSSFLLALLLVILPLLTTLSLLPSTFPVPALRLPTQNSSRARHLPVTPQEWPHKAKRVVPGRRNPRGDGQDGGRKPGRRCRGERNQVCVGSGQGEEGEKDEVIMWIIRIKSLIIYLIYLFPFKGK